jgi:D-amino-acid dehydrogenase
VRLGLAAAGAPAEETFDAAVVCAGVQAPALLAPWVQVPLLPVYGYSLTAEIRSLAAELPREPRAGLMDERYKVAITRLGSRVRVAGSAEIGGHPEALSPRALATLHKVLRTGSPGCADVSTVRYWKGARPMLPDGPPLIGRSTAAGIWLNLGQGSSGWALSCGSARLLADLCSAARRHWTPPPSTRSGGAEGARSG